MSRYIPYRVQVGRHKIDINDYSHEFDNIADAKTYCENNGFGNQQLLIIGFETRPDNTINENSGKIVYVHGMD